MAAIATTHLCFIPRNPTNILQFHSLSKSTLFIPNIYASASIARFSSSVSPFKSNNVKPLDRLCRLTCNTTSSTVSATTKNYEFSDGSYEVELRLPLGNLDIHSSKDIYVDADGTSLTVRVQRHGSFITLIETNNLFDKIKPAETIWYIDEDQLVINLKKQDPELKWPDIVESWESLTAGGIQLLKGTSIYIVGDSTEVNQNVAQELALGLGYTPLNTKELLETFTKQTVDSWLLAEGFDSVAEAEGAVLESLSSHVRAVVATLGGQQGVARRADKWRHLYAGFTVWLSQTEAMDEDSAKEEARRHIQDGNLAYSKADVVVKLQGWDADHARSVAQASLHALKQLILSDKKLPGTTPWEHLYLTEKQ
ncbi:inactive shikimate kinase like 2 chloroplastic-like isoform X1 [Tripterygium wilfordii]|uniref:Inactive shikimate kinase like 2 chloroplastic-like isoform X1 n=1 Tax=Tripterygium wilfordii TaxID=458696 RepID=A0A7J7CJS6_TRIWF|nr:inactive shikimate kinase like 2 chloroplastic-like isoform X1 [Tripterygium wilfordii]